MPKRGNGGGGRGRAWNDGEYQGSRGYSYNEHDNRGHENVRRVSFKQNSSSKIHKNKSRNWNAALKHFNDEDVDMAGQSSNAAGGRNQNNNIRGNFRGGRGWRDGRVNSPAPRPNNTYRKLLPGLSPWYQITIPFGQQHEKQFLLGTLLTAMNPDVFIPYYYSIVGNAAIFYVDDFGLAEKLNNLDRKISMPNGFKLGVKVKSGAPHVTVDKPLLDKMKTAMASRYNPATKALDLTKFHADPALVDVFCALFRPPIMLAVVNIISENIPELQALNLNENKLQVLDHFKSLLKKLPNLKILYLAKNRVAHVSSLEPLTSCPLIELFLEGNPLADRFNEKDVYIREIRKRFPKLIRLDGNDLPPVIGFDVSDEVSLPPIRASFLCNADGQGIVRQFLEQYFAIYDSESRQPLLDAYHENAMMSMTSWYGHGQAQYSSHNRLHAYTPVSRNLMRLVDRDIRRRSLKNGRLQVVAFLNDLPKTLHDPQSFCVDLTLFTPTIIILTVSGVFKETSSSSGSSKANSTPPLRAFHKSMIIVPQGGGFCIRNDMLHITNASSEQEESSFKGPSVVANVAPPPYTAAPPPYTPAVPVVHEAPVLPGVPQMDHQQMLQAFALQTNMNLAWSTSCLEQTNWDYQRAALVFTNLQKEGKIPPEAFVK